MMTYQDFKRRVEELAHDRFPMALYNAVMKQHMKHGFKTSCPCFYCQEKRSISNAPGWSRFWDRLSISSRYRRLLKEAAEREE